MTAVENEKRLFNSTEETYLSYMYRTGESLANRTCDSYRQVLLNSSKSAFYQSVKGFMPKIKKIQQEVSIQRSRPAILPEQSEAGFTM